MPVSGMKVWSLAGLSAHLHSIGDSPSVAHECCCDQINWWVIVWLFFSVIFWSYTELKWFFNDWKKLSQFSQNVWKYRLMNTVKACFYTAVRHMTEMFQWSKCHSKKLNVSAIICWPWYILIPYYSTNYCENKGNEWWFHNVNDSFVKLVLSVLFNMLLVDRWKGHSTWDCDIRYVILTSKYFLKSLLL